MLKGHEREVNPGEEPTFTWFKSGQEFDPGDRFKVLCKDDEDTLGMVSHKISLEVIHKQRGQIFGYLYPPLFMVYVILLM